VKSGERAMDAPGAKRASEEGSSSHSVGQYLANQRRLRRISLEELSERTRIPRRNLERLESGAFDATADGFTRGFVRTVAEALGLDADDAVMRLVDEPHHADELRALIAARRAVMWRVAALAAVAVLVLVGAVYLVLHPPAHEDAKPALTWRRDAVRGLAEHEQRESGSAPAPQRAAP
jgi:transcriptional regulator with XRE-family HTH domain